MKTYAVLGCLVLLNLNCNEMNDKECFNTKNFHELKTQITENNSSIQLHERLVADKETTALELSTSDKYLELVEIGGNAEIIVIDKSQKLPTYTCTITSNQIQLSAYESRFDTEQDIENRRNDWCSIVASLVLDH